MNGPNPQSSHAGTGWQNAQQGGAPGADASADPTLQVRKASESALDDAVEATFPASDPVALTSTKAVPAEDVERQGRPER
ncbi:hypothetical protein [Melaminivora alkalimesophila]|uniref:Uncharacterized protein n=1 Tax=Melaminivora alkalimesophila TaxID=1165852 RepID=A0A317RDA8_9BURK|nr:hypothetical protein [Melaminivora alkalimesophila]PWW47730.1 hypothetical protein DFR36_102103 [Melaminivora alkalimesophila]